MTIQMKAIEQHIPVGEGKSGARGRAGEFPFPRASLAPATQSSGDIYFAPGMLFKEFY